MTPFMTGICARLRRAWGGLRKPQTDRTHGGYWAKGALFLLLGLALACGSSSTPAGTPAPTSLTYSSNPAFYTQGSAITANRPSSGGGAVASYAVAPALPAGLALSTSSGVISGTPTVLAPAANYVVTATNAGGSTTATVNISVVPAPTTPTITVAPNVTASLPGRTASIVAQTGCTYAWTITAGGTITAGATTPSITFTPAASGTVELSCVVTNAAGAPSTAGTASSTIVAAATTPTITVAAYVTANLAGRVASIEAQAGCTYAWIITAGGTITAGTTTPSITFTPDATGTVALSCVVTNAAGTPSTAGTASSTIVAVPSTPTITVAASVTANLAGRVASIEAQTNCTYEWTLTGGTITTGATTPSITFTPDATGTAALSCVVTNAAGTPSTAGTANSTIVAAATTPVITVASSVTAGLAGRPASVPAQTGCTYGWEITGGTIDAGGTTRSITFTPNPSGTVTLTCTVTNAAGTPYVSAATSSTIVAAAAIQSFVATAPLISLGESTSLVAEFTGDTGVVSGAGTIDPASGAITSTGSVTVTPTNTTTYTLTVANSLGDAVTQTVQVVLNPHLRVTVTAAAFSSGAITPSVRVTGPGGFDQTITTTLDVPTPTAGTYTITADTVTDTGLTGLGRENGGTLGPVNLLRYPLQAVQTVTVGASGVTTASVLYPAATLTIPIPVIGSTPATSVPMDFVLMPAGSFAMGAPDTSPDPNPDGATLNPYPVHAVTFAKAFYMARTAVTQAQWTAIRGASYFEFRGDPTLPAESMLWDEIRGTGGFLELLNAATGKAFSLPSEAQWEYACRAGTTSAYFFGDANIDGDPVSDLDLYAVTVLNSPTTTLPVASKRPNPWGLYDITGNVWSWMEDDAIHTGGTVFSYAGAPTDGSAWLEASRTVTGILRGGGRDPNEKWYRSAIRYDEPFSFPGGRTVGLRLVMPVAP